MYNNKFQIYLGGGISGLDEKQATAWRFSLRQSIFTTLDAVGINKDSVRVFNPVVYMDEEAELRDDGYDFEMMDLDLFNLKHSDLMIVNFNNPESIGTAMEISKAYDMNIPIVGILPKIRHTYNGSLGKQFYADAQLFVDDLHPWIQNMTTKFFTSDYNAVAEYAVNTYLL